jgi:hypothetical protein
VIPTYEWCQLNPDDPEVVNQWALVAIKLVGSEAFTPDEESRRWLSKHLHDLGFRHHPELCEKKLRTPPRGPQHVLNNLSTWVGLDEPEPEPLVIPDVSAYTVHEQEIIAEQLRYTGVVPTPTPEPDGLAEAAAAPFDPSDHSPSTVNGYLMAAGDAERRRVVALEMVGKRRDQILRKWPAV